jgi:hypothetical protein
VKKKKKQAARFSKKAGVAGYERARDETNAVSIREDQIIQTLFRSESVELFSFSNLAKLLGTQDSSLLVADFFSGL